jgi:hypothetical protein
MNDRELLKTFVDVMFHKYGSYAHATGYLESTVVGLLEGNDSIDDVRRRIAQAIEKETAKETV